MPLNKDALYRYRLIDQRLRNTMLPRPSLDALLRYVSEKLEKSVSRRTLLSDIKAMRESPDLNFYAPIAYDSTRKGYYYSEEGYAINNIPITEYELQGLEIAVGILRQFHKLPVIRQFEDAILKIADAVTVNREKLQDIGVLHLDAPTRFKGLEWLPEIAEAIQNREVLRLSYQSFDRDAPKDYRIEPYHLREYNHRFYVFARSLHGENPGLRTFGLDRIHQIWPTYKHFDARHFDDAAYFKNAIGITVPNEKPVKILLSFSPRMGKYVKTQPLHHSQKVIKDDADALQVELLLVVNPELIMLLLGYGAAVRVVYPRSLAADIAKEAKKIVNLYD